MELLLELPGMLYRVTRCKDRTIGSRVMRLFVELQLYQKFTRVAETEQRLTNHQGSGAATSQRDTTTSRY